MGYDGNVVSQLSLGFENVISPAVTGTKELYGEVFTRPWVVEMILDLAGYDAATRLFERTVVEPSCGAGAFLGSIVDRLAQSCRDHDVDLHDMSHAIQAVDLLPRNVELSRKVVAQKLVALGLIQDEADELAARWVTQGDFLLRRYEPGSVDFVIGNPPYLRLEDVDRPTLEAYRRECATMRGRADVYVGFIERSLKLLRSDGVLGFIVADRWMRNQYGASLRKLISESCSVDAIVQMHDVDAFEDRVSAYPAVTIIRHRPQGPAVVVEAQADFNAGDAADLVKWSRSGGDTVESPSWNGARLSQWFRGDGFWPMGRPDDLAMVAELERRWPPLEDATTSTRVGIGVATGADGVYLTCDTTAVENDRLLPIVTAGDVASGQVQWSGTHLVNPWQSDGLVDLEQFPSLTEYFRANESSLRARHIGSKNPRNWYRTIDRVDPALRERPKLLVPDLKASIHPVLDHGEYYPHHNLYYVVSDAWDLEVLGGILLSNISNLFVGTYCVKMRGGCYRFQAQYLRRIRVPAIDSLTQRDRSDLASAFTNRDVERATAVVMSLMAR